MYLRVGGVQPRRSERQDHPSFGSKLDMGPSRYSAELLDRILGALQAWRDLEPQNSRGIDIVYGIVNGSSKDVRLLRVLTILLFLFTS